MKIAFDIDDTLLIHEEDTRGETSPNFGLIQVLRWFKANGEEIYFWSAGGQDYCKTMVRKLGLSKLGTVIEKEVRADMDISFDDQEVHLAKVNIQVDPDV